MSVRCIVLAVLVWLGLPAMALAVLPPDTYRDARRAADHHVQIRVDRITPPRKTPGRCAVEGDVVTVFRSAGSGLGEGMAVSFGVDCLAPGDEPMVGGTLWIGAAELREARYLEVYLNDSGEDGVAVARWQYVIVDGPSETPRCPEDHPGLSCR